VNDVSGKNFAEKNLLHKKQVEIDLSGKKQVENEDILITNFVVQKVNDSITQHSDTTEMPDVFETMKHSLAHDISGKEGTSVIVLPVSDLEGEGSFNTSSSKCL